MIAEEDIVLMSLMDDEIDLNIVQSGTVSKTLRLQSQIAGICAPYFHRSEHPKLSGYAELLDAKDDEEFLQLLRVGHKTFDFILDQLFLEDPRDIQCGRPPIEDKLNLMITLWYLAHQCTFQEIAEQFGLSKSCIHNNIDETINKIAELSSKFIKWPTHDDVWSVASNFSEVGGFPNVVGAIDGCHIKFKAPADLQKDYLDRTLNHSTNLLAVCNADQIFTYIYAGFPGSAHDQRVLNCSDLGERLETNAHSLGITDDYHLIGDSAFTLKTYMMVPFKDMGNMTNAQIEYNTTLSKTRRVIENAFGWLKGRFRRLKYIDADLCRVSNIITASCVLHNIALQYEDEREMLLLDNPILHLDNDDNERISGARAQARAKQKRNDIMNLVAHD